MLQNINISFLGGLAFISWLVLYYIHVVQHNQQKQSIADDYTIEIYTEHSNFNNEAQNTSQPEPLLETYELLINYGILFAAIVALSKVLQFCDLHSIRNFQRHISTHLFLKKSQFSPYKSNDNDKKLEEKSICPQSSTQNSLRGELTDLQTLCGHLLQEITEVKRNIDHLEPKTNSMTSIENWAENMMTYSADNTSYVSTFDSKYVEIPTSSSMRNIYLNRNQIQINFNGPITLSQHNLRVELPPKDIRALCRTSQSTSEFRQVFGKYIEGPIKLSAIRVH